MFSNHKRASVDEAPDWTSASWCLEECLSQSQSRTSSTFLLCCRLCLSPLFDECLNLPVSKTNLAVHEDKNRVPFVKVGPRARLLTSCCSCSNTAVLPGRAVRSALSPVLMRSWTSSTREKQTDTWPSPVSHTCTAAALLTTVRHRGHMTGLASPPKSSPWTSEVLRGPGGAESSRR